MPVRVGEPGTAQQTDPESLGKPAIGQKKTLGKKARVYVWYVSNVKPTKCFVNFFITFLIQFLKLLFF